MHAASSGYAVTDVNLRSGPGVRYRVKAVIPRRARITIYRCRVRWCRVSWRGIRGWTSRRYVAFARTYRPRRRVYRPPFYDPYYDDPFYDPFMMGGFGPGMTMGIGMGFGTGRRKRESGRNEEPLAGVCPLGQVRRGKRPF